MAAQILISPLDNIPPRGIYSSQKEYTRKNIARINADYHLDNDLDEYYLWDYETHTEVIELEVPEDLKEDIENGAQTALTFKFDDEHSYTVEVENVEQLKPSELYERRMLDCLVNYTTCFKDIEDESEEINNEKQN